MATRASPRWRCNPFVPFLEFPPELRRVVYTTNAIESLNARFRRTYVRTIRVDVIGVLFAVDVAPITSADVGRQRRSW